MRLVKPVPQAMLLPLVLCLLFCATASAQTSFVPARVTQAIDEKNLVTLQGNVHPLARPEFDQGPAPLDLHMDRMLLVLKHSPQQQAALEKLLDDQQDKSSPHYRR